MTDMSYPLLMFCFVSSCWHWFVQITVGRMHLVSKQLKQVRGGSCTIKVDQTSTADNILQLAVEKQCACNWYLSRDSDYILLYPDGRLVESLPASHHPFTLAAYRDFMDKPFQKLTFFICDREDFVAGIHNSVLC